MIGVAWMRQEGQPGRGQDHAELLASAVTTLGARNRVDAARIAEEVGWL